MLIMLLTLGCLVLKCSGEEERLSACHPNSGQVVGPIIGELRSSQRDGTAAGTPAVAAPQTRPWNELGAPCDDAPNTVCLGGPTCIEGSCQPIESLGIVASACGL